MPTRRLERSDWKSYLDGINHHLPASTVEIEVDGLDIGAQVEASRVPLDGLTYEPDADMLEVAARGLQHVISAPRQIHVQEREGGGLESLEVVDSEGHKQIIKLTPVLSLPTA